ncbi:MULTISPECIES: hypothetical protein [unclassified Microcoleus]
MQVFWATLFFNTVSVLAVGVVEVLATAANAKVEGAIADISMNNGQIKIWQFILVSPSQVFE